MNLPQRTNLAGISEMRECLKRVPASRAHECLKELVEGPFDVKVEMNWTWLAIGFIAGWILKR